MPLDRLMRSFGMTTCYRTIWRDLLDWPSTGGSSIIIYFRNILRDWYKPVSKTAKKNKEDTKLEPESGVYQEIGPNWACLGLQTNFWERVQNWRRSL